MKLVHKQAGWEYSVELTRAGHDTIRLDVSEVASGVVGHAILDQVTALSLARLIEEMVKDIRRK